MSHSWNSIRQLLSGVALCIATCWATTAHAEEEFPGALQEAADMECVPSCLMCHSVNPGTAATFLDRTLGKGLYGTGKLESGTGNVAAFNEAWRDWSSKPENAAHVGLIKQGTEPMTMQNVCGPSYGCGATFAGTRAGATPMAVSGAFALLAMLWLARRRR